MAGTPVVAAITPTSAPVHINVGGTTYTSCLETLTKFPYSKLAKLFNGSLPVAVDPVKHRYFLDRDGKVFRHILNFLRNSELILPNTFSEFDLLKKEAAYFEIEDLIKALEDNQQSNNGTEEQAEQSSDDNTKVTCKTQLQGRERKRRKKRNKQIVKDKLGNEMLEVDTENEFTEEVDLKKETLVRSKSNTTIVSAKHLSTKEETNKVKDKSPVPDEREVLQVQSSVETVVVDKELVCVVTDTVGGVQELWCSDKNFNLEIPQPPNVDACNLKVCTSYDCGELDRLSQIIRIPYLPCPRGRGSRSVSLGFPWVAKQLFKQGYKLRTASGIYTLYNFFVK